MERGSAVARKKKSASSKAEKASGKPRKLSKEAKAILEAEAERQARQDELLKKATVQQTQALRALSIEELVREATKTVVRDLSSYSPYRDGKDVSPPRVRR